MSFGLDANQPSTALVGDNDVRCQQGLPVIRARRGILYLPDRQHALYYPAKDYVLAI